MAFILIKKKIEYIKDAILNPNYLEAFCLKVFELLFIGKNNFELYHLNKKYDFLIILKALRNGSEKEKE